MENKEKFLEWVEQNYGAEVVAHCMKIIDANPDMSPDDVILSATKEHEDGHTELESRKHHMRFNPKD